jgi:Holliday junction resolvasome RuvABC endonuclease subunit
MITGNGNCDKNQMMKTIQLIFSLKEKIQPDDISDSIAIAITHYRTSKFEAIRKEALNDIFNKR